jgi:hypothetical protein
MSEYTFTFCRNGWRYDYDYDKPSNYTVPAGAYIELYDPNCNGKDVQVRTYTPGDESDLTVVEYNGRDRWTLPTARKMAKRWMLENWPIDDCS